MVHKPPLPDDYELPERVNEWVLDPETGKNGHTWYAPDESAAVMVGGLSDGVSVKALDERVSGFARSERIYQLKVEDSDYADENSEGAKPPGLVTDAVKRAVTWMERHPPSEWEHPAVCDAAFDPPVGFVLDRYYLEEREHIICYRQADAEKDVNLSGRPPKSEPSLETRSYLYVEVWRGSGNATVSLAPWLRAHDSEKHEVVGTPDECGVEVALKLAREWVHEETGESRDSPARGQADLGAWSA